MASIPGEFIRGVRLFQHLTHDEIQQLLDASEEVSFDSGATVFDEGEKGRALVLSHSQHSLCLGSHGQRPSLYLVADTRAHPGIDARGYTVAMDFKKAARVSQIPEADAISVRVDSHEIGLFKVDGVVYAVDNVCPHRGGPLHEGLLKDCTITCPWHDWSFDLRDGQCTFHKDLALRTFDVRIEGDDVLVGV